MARRPVDLDAEPLPELDRRPGAPHPRETARLVGHGGPWAEVMAAIDADAMPTGLLLAGPEGVGKATFAYRVAERLLGDERAVRAGTHPGLFVLRRTHDEKGKARTRIVIEDARGLGGFFGLSAADGGRRVVIVDSACEMTGQAANAILKLLEEPPRDAHLLLVAHRPASLLPTIRSRCRLLRFGTLSPAETAEALAPVGLDRAEAEALAPLAGGSPGVAVGLAATGGLGLYRELLAVLAPLPRMDRAARLRLAEGPRGAGAERAETVLDLLDGLLARLAQAPLGRAPLPAEADLARRMAPDAGAARRIADLAAATIPRARRALALNLDPASVLLDTLLAIEQGAGHARR